jgi:hypothetical protein
MKLFSTTLLLGAACSVAASANAGLIAHYTFDSDGSATVGTDATLGEGASIDNTNFVAGGGSLLLDPNAIVTDTSGADGAVGGDSFDWSGSDVRTVTFFVRASSTQVDALGTMISLGSGTGGGNRFDIRLDNGNLRLEVQAGGSTTGSALADDTWHHVAIVVPGATSTVNDVQYYIDGALVGTFSNAQNIDTGVGPLRIGDSYQDTGRDFTGNIDDVRLYDTALTANEIAALAAIPEPGSLALLGLGGLAMLRRRRG